MGVDAISAGFPASPPGFSGGDSDGIASRRCDNFPSVGTIRLGCLTAALVTCLACAQAATAGSTFRPRIRGAMGIVPPYDQTDIAAGESIPVVYHGGSVMHGATIHMIFWAPPGYRFDGPPAPGILGYEPLIQRFFSDAVHDVGTHSNVFSVLPEYPDQGGPGRYAIAYDPSADSIDDADPYPPQSRQCPSPASLATCLTDHQVQRELDRVIESHDPAGHGLHDLWFVFLPPDVDTCIAVGQCGTTAYAGYHALSNLGRGPTIYAVIPDPLIEFTPGPGTDPQGNPEAESAIDTVAHETVEAITNPEGDGWMDPNGFEVADKCENPEDGTPLGFAPDGSPYNQVISGDQFLVQMMWSNAHNGCEQRSSSTTSALPTASVDVPQFSDLVSGSIGSRTGGVSVLIGLIRANDLVALGQAETRANGSWGPAPLRSESGSGHAPSDDRDVLVVQYGPGGPRPNVITTGAGGNPFTESGWTGWFDLDHGFKVGRGSVALAPCGQTGVLGLRIGARAAAPPIEQCDTETDAATVRTGALSARTTLTLSSQDNRAVTLENPAGALVKLTVPLGEPGSVSALPNGQIPFQPSGFPSCTADLRAQAVRCFGLGPGAEYSLGRRRARADSRGQARFAGFMRPVRGGQVLSLSNQAGRVLTRLHVAHLRVDIEGQQSVVAGGRCQPGDYYGLPLAKPPISDAIGLGVSGDGTVCPASGSASGLSVAHISQIDDLSGGLTRTEVPQIQRTTPIDGELVYGPFIAQAHSGLPAPHNSMFATGAPIRLTITPVRSHHPVFHAHNVDIVRGVPVRSLPRGAYVATWILRDANGDTRTTRTEFVEQR